MSARHAAAGARRPVSLLMVAATVLGVWFGLRAPEISPVTPMEQLSPVSVVVDDDGDDGRPQRIGPR